MEISEEYQKAIPYQREFIKKIVDNVGPRLPTSPEEKKAAEMMADDFSRATGSPSKVESFECHPMASIAFIPALGYILLFGALPLFYFSPLGSTLVVGILLFYAIMNIFRYTSVFDFLFPKGTSHNTYSVMEPASGQVDYTLVLIGHIDSSWQCKLFLKFQHKAQFLLIYGVVSAVVLFFASIIYVISPAQWILFVPIPLVPGFFFLSQYLTWDAKKASPGAMDNLSGIAETMWAAKYLKEHPETIKNCRVVLLAVGSEEAGLKGSEAFIENHKNDLLTINPWVVIVDSVADFDYFQVVDGDEWLGTKYDNELCTLAEEAMKSAGLKYTRMKNPAGGTDGAAFSRKNIRVVTLNAQNPGPNNNYHTCLDTLEKIDEKTQAKMAEVTIKLIEKIDKRVHSPKN